MGRFSSIIKRGTSYVGSAVLHKSTQATLAAAASYTARKAALSKFGWTGPVVSNVIAENAGIGAGYEIWAHPGITNAALYGANQAGSWLLSKKQAPVGNGLSYTIDDEQNEDDFSFVVPEEPQQTLVKDEHALIDHENEYVLIDNPSTQKEDTVSTKKPGYIKRICSYGIGKTLRFTTNTAGSIAGNYIGHGVASYGMDLATIAILGAVPQGPVTYIAYQGVKQLAITAVSSETMRYGYNHSADICYSAACGAKTLGQHALNYFERPLPQEKEDDNASSDDDNDNNAPSAEEKSQSRSRPLHQSL